MKYFILIVSFLLPALAFSQNASSSLTDRIIVKTNVLNVLANRPSITVEKIFSDYFSAEISYVNGQVRDVIYLDKYGYSGFLL